MSSSKVPWITLAVAGAATTATATVIIIRRRIVPPAPLQVPEVEVEEVEEEFVLQLPSMLPELSDEQERVMVDAFDSALNRRATLPFRELGVPLRKLDVKGIQASLEAVREEIFRQFGFEWEEVTLQQFRSIYRFCLRPVSEDLYDIVAEIGDPSLADPWPVIISRNYLKECDPKALSMKGFRVAIVGFYNTGKSFLLNLLMDMNVVSSDVKHTQGLCFKSLKTPTKTDYIFLDTLGLNSMPETADPDGLAAQKRADNFLLDLAFSFGHFVIYVVDKVSRTDLKYLYALKKRVQNTRRHVNIIVVHNFRDAEDLEVVSELWKNQCVNFFPGGELLNTAITLPFEGESRVSYFTSTIGRHIFLAREGSEAGRRYNRLHVALLLQFIALLNTDTTPMHPVHHLAELCNTDESLQRQLNGNKVVMEYSTPSTRVQDEKPLLTIGALKKEPQGEKEK